MPDRFDSPIDRLFEGAPQAAEPVDEPASQSVPRVDIDGIGRLTRDVESPLDRRYQDPDLELGQLVEESEPEELKKPTTFLARLHDKTQQSNRNRFSYSGVEVTLSSSGGVPSYSDTVGGRSVTVWNLAELNHAETNTPPVQPLPLPCIVEVTERILGAGTLYTIDKTLVPIHMFPVKVGQATGFSGNATTQADWTYEVYDRFNNTISTGWLSPEARLQDHGRFDAGTTGLAYYDIDGTLKLWFVDESQVTTVCTGGGG